MSRPRKTPIVSRDYRAVPDDCARALVLLLTKSVTKEVGRPAPEPADRDGTKVQEDPADASIISN